MGRRSVKTENPNRYIFIIGFIAVGIITTVLLRRQGPPEFPIITIQESAWTACIALAKEQLKIDHIDADIYSRYSVMKLMERDHYSAIVYATDGGSYKCDLARLISGRWFLKSLYIK